VKNLQALAREHTEEAIDALIAALKHPAIRVSAATALLDRGYGRPIQTTSHRVIRSVADLTDQELGALLASEEAAEADQQARH
jgi:HEAT repeat protein